MRLERKIIIDNIRRVKDKIAETALKAGRDPQDIHLMAVTKNNPCDAVAIALDEGISLFGENRVQEALRKFPRREERNYKLHMIGHLQSNKARKAVGFFDLIQSVDSRNIAEEINKRAEQDNIVCDVFIEINIGNENSKSGFSSDETDALPELFIPLKNICVKGIMAIPPFNYELNETRRFFVKMRKIYEKIQDEKIFGNNFTTLSMGMSHDYAAAIEEGANLLRIGTALFGARQ
ncbi:YggS family pyridoxal phosphate-dependent enzyme [bacterium]|nr:YggS family pyridoxal phosphate-dependent enzyme [bacterium]